MVNSPLFFTYIFVIGAAMGSFLNVLADRLPNDKSLLGRSHCDYCKKTLTGLDLVPIFSFLYLRGRCRYCKKKLSYFYPAVEVLTGIVFVLTWYFLGETVREKILYLDLAATLIVIFFADVKYQIIPDSMQISLVSVGLALSFLHGGNFFHIFLTDIYSGVAVMAPILFLFLVTRGRGMGFGDVKLAFGMGVLLGWLGGLIAVYIGFMTGGLLGCLLFFTGKKGLKSKIAFGPFLVIGLVTLVFAHDNIISFATSLFIHK